MNVQLTVSFSFGKIVVDPKSNAIYLNGVEKRLEPKLIALLCLLAAQGRDVISRQEITQNIWPGVVVGEESITRAIFALRNALGDDAKQPQFIETIPKKGYRFLVDVQLLAKSVPAFSIFAVRRLWGIYLLGLVLVIALFTILGRNGKPIFEIESILPLTKMEGVERAISLSAEGNKLLFIHDNGQNNDLYSHDLQASKDTLWIRDEFLKKSPIWIDDNTIAYIRQHGSDIQVVRNYQGQSPEILYTSSKPILQLSMIEGDSENLFFLEFENNDLIQLRSLNLRNGKQQNWRDFIQDLPNKISQLQYSMKPNTLLMVKDENEKPVIVSLDLDTKKNAIVNNQFSEINKIAAVTDHSLLVVGVLGTSEGIWLVDAAKQPQLLLRSSGSEKIVDVQIDVKRNIIFYANLQKNIDIKIIFSHSQEVVLLPELNSSGLDVNGVFANRNKSIYFVSNRTGYFEIWRYDIGLKSLKQISTLNALSITWFSLSHTEENIAVGYKTDNLYLGVIDTETGRLQQHVKTVSHRFPLAWSYDDKVIYVSEHQTEINLFSYDVKTLTQSLFADKSGLYVKDVDGKKLIFVDYKRHAFVERSLTTAQEKILHDTIPTLLSLIPGRTKLNKANDGVYTGCQIDLHDKVCFYSLSTTSSSPVVVSDISYRQLFDISEDGETIIAADIKPSSGDIMKMQLKH